MVARYICITTRRPNNFVASKKYYYDAKFKINWQHASFKDTQFTDLIFSGLLEECFFSNCAFSKITFKNATLKNSFFKYSDVKRVEFIDCRADPLTYEFLKNCKADLSEITLLQ